MKRFHGNARMRTRFIGRLSAAVFALTFVVASAGAEPPPFDFDEGNAALEIVIPAAVPAIFASVSPSDATLVLRFTTMITNAWFDATAPYHPTAVGVYSRLGRRPVSESLTNANINVAILYASFRTLNSLFPAFSDHWREMMESVGLDPDFEEENTTEAAAIGNAAANAMLAVRENDGMNQLGFEGGRIYNPRPYGDYTGYAPVNNAYELKHPGRWQPAIRVTPHGISTVQQFVTPQFALVLPYSFDDPTVFAVSPPFKSFWSGAAKAKDTLNGPNKPYKDQADEVLHASANLTDEQKMIAELFDDKIRSLGFSTIFAALVRGLSVLEFVQYDFLVNVAAFDTGIVMWQEKVKHDAVRPFSAIRHIYGNAPVTAWGGPGQGAVADLPADQWQSYLPVADHPEYPSGSTGFCEAHAQASRLFFGDDLLGWTVPAPAGSSLIEPGFTPAQDIALHWGTWSDFAEDCGFSRFWGGVHFLDSINNMRMLGTAIGGIAFDFVMAHIDGTAD